MRRGSHGAAVHDTVVAVTSVLDVTAVRRRWSTVTSAVLVGALVCGVLAACAVDGQAVGRPDLTSRSVAATDFPNAGATQIPTSAVAFALDGLTGSDQAVVTPTGCTPTRLTAGGAVAFQLITDDGAASYTTGVAYAPDTLDAVVTQARRCSSGTTAGGTVGVRVDPAPQASTGVHTAAVRRTTSTGGDEKPLITTSLTLFAQRDDVRVAVQYRWSGSGEIPGDAAASLDALYTKAVAAAFA